MMIGRTALAAMVLMAASGARAEAPEPLYDFGYSYPAVVRAIPPLKAWMDAQAAARRKQLIRDATTGRQDARKAGFPYHSYTDSTTWSVVTNTPRFLSLSLVNEAYSGGAHGMSSFDAMLWDRATQKRLAPISLFVSARALRAAIQDRFCAALDKQRAEKRGAPVNRASGDEFDKCIDPLENTLMLGSSNGRTFDRIGVTVGPYAAGPYVEGAYDVTLPVTSAIYKAVKPAYRAYFKLAAR